MQLKVLPDRVRRACERLKRAGLHNSPQRIIVLLTFYCDCLKPVSVDELWKLVKAKDGRISYETSNRLLETMMECGLASKTLCVDGIARFHHSENRCNHPELVCMECGAIIDGCVAIDGVAPAQNENIDPAPSDDAA